MVTFNLQQTVPQDPSILLVCALGIGVVFIGLIFLVFIVNLMNVFFDKKGNKKNSLNDDVISAHSPQTNEANIIENKQEIIAAVCAAVAEENGTDISAIRVISFKKI